MSSNLPSTICMLPWISIETSPVGTIRPCCLADEEITHPDGSKFKLTESTLEDAYRSEYMQQLRQQFLNGEKPSTCRRCWDEEAAGRASKRINSRIRLKEYYNEVDFTNTNPDQLWFIDLKLGNICNLKCRICGSWSSSKWVNEEIDYVKDLTNRKEHLAYKFLVDGAWPRESEVFWDNLRTLLPNIRYFEFTGGEPFLIQQHFDLLRYAAETGHSEHIEVHYNTNGTQFPTDEIEVWSKFKHVEVAFSIDNVGDRFEYERYGAVWAEVEENIAKFQTMRGDQFSTQVCMTINTQNVYYLPELCEWVKTQNFDHTYFNMLHDPQHMNIAYMTPEAQKLVIDRLSAYEFEPRHRAEIQRIIQFIQNGPGSDGEFFRQRMQTTDQYREQTFLATHAEIARAMGYE